MNARDVMSSDVKAVSPETPLRDVAKTLLAHQISAIPVIDSVGVPIGMVSEGDLIGRKRTERETRSEWWLTRLAEGEPLNAEFLAHLQSPLAVAREVMSSPVITVAEDTPLDEIATLMATHRVKRVPVVRDGRVVGIVRRADLLRAMGGGRSAPLPRPPEPQSAASAWADEVDGVKRPQGDHETAPFAAPSSDADLSVADFQHFVEHFKETRDADRARQRAIAAAARRRDLRRLIDTHISDNGWNGLLHGAREAAEHGETEFLLLRFPCQLCSDGGRAINAPDPEWAHTLRGEAAEMYLRWERELRPRGFHLAARVVDFPDGIPGDVGLFLVWGGSG
jgi:CBS domain-containing protein